MSFSDSVITMPGNKHVLSSDHMSYIIRDYEGPKRSIMLPPSLGNVGPFAEVNEPSKKSRGKNS